MQYCFFYHKKGIYFVKIQNEEYFCEIVKDKNSEIKILGLRQAVPFYFNFKKIYEHFNFFKSLIFRGILVFKNY